MAKILVVDDSETIRNQVASALERAGFTVEEGEVLTERARALVQSGEYRYFSPVFEYARGSGEVTRILMGALTNHPAIAGMEAVNLMAAASARFTTTPTTSTSKQQGCRESKGRGWCCKVI